ncbi:MAG: SMI1/KNR4 family protein [Burkholderiaceae bacterium]|nr:SMI1/KNR4 family protein [Burkholderiaceae bacterium]
MQRTLAQPDLDTMSFIGQKRTLPSPSESMSPTEFIDAYLPLAQRLRDVTVPGRESVPRPLPGATEQQLAAVESHLGVKLDSQHRTFLNYANGWPEFSGTFSLFGTADLLDSALMSGATTQLRIISNTAMGRFRSKRKQLLPIAVSDGSLGVWCMPIEKGQVQPAVIWFNNTEPDEHPTFNAFLDNTLATLPERIIYFTDRERRPLVS